MRAPSEAFRDHWPEYLSEAAGLGLFMVAVAAVTTALEYPNSPLRDLLPDASLRRVLIGLSMGLTTIGIIYSPWGKRSGAHLNPAVTFTFFRIGKLESTDALFCVAAQFIGGLIGLLLAAAAIGAAIEHPAVNYREWKGDWGDRCQRGDPSAGRRHCHGRGCDRGVVHQTVAISRPLGKIRTELSPGRVCSSRTAATVVQRRFWARNRV